MADRFFIAPYDQNSGLQTNVKPWLVPDNAFSELTNAYVYRGRVRKRFGYRWIENNPFSSRLRVRIGQTNGAGLFNGSTPLNTSGDPIVTPAIGQMFSIGGFSYTVVALGNPANLLRNDGVVAVATFDTTTGAVIIDTNNLLNDTPVYYYPALPVMGLLTYEDPLINDEIAIAFDTRFAYEYLSPTGWERLDNEATPGASYWLGSNSQFFWATTWTGVSAADKVFFVTNFNPNEYVVGPNHQVAMRYFFNNQWQTFRPDITDPLIMGTIFLNTARILVPFKNRLIAFNTYEGNDSVGTNYSNRARYSQIGDPLDVNAWRQDIPGRGNAIDASTTEAIITVEFIKDRLIVYFERSTWEFVYTGNQTYPFIWQKINTELGCESTFSVVPFDKVALGVGNVGIHACNGTNVERIDNLIPDEVFEIHNNNQGTERVYGIRDYFVEMVYWTFPNTQAGDDFPFPNRVLVYNYKTGTWAFNEESITCFGYLQLPVGITWNSETVTWDDAVTWSDGAGQALHRNIVAGNQQGWVFIIDSNATTNASVLQITNIGVVNNVVTLTSLDHNFREGDFIFLQNIDGTGNLNLLNDKIFKVTAITPNTLTFVYDLPDIIAGNYNGAGLIARVSNIKIATKQYNFYAKQGRNAYIPKIDFMVDSSPAGQLQVEYFISTSQAPLLQDSILLGTSVGTGTLDTFPYILGNPGVEVELPYEATATRLWRTVYFQGEGECIQFRITMNDDQMRNLDIWRCDFQLHAIVITAQPTSRLQ